MAQLNIDVCVGKRVLLPNYDDPVPATIVIDHNSGKIVDIQHRITTRNDFGTSTINSWIDAGDFMVLPGLVE